MNETTAREKKGLPPSWVDKPRTVDKKLKADSSTIHGTDQYRKGQTTLTAKVELPNGDIVKVATQNESAGWRAEQEAIARKLGYEPLSTSKPGSGLHAEGELEAYRKAQSIGGKQAKVLEWAISRGEGGTSVVCNEGCKNFAEHWGPQQK